MNSYDLVHHAPIIALVLAAFMIAVAFCIPNGASSRLGLVILTVAAGLIVASVLHDDDGRTFIEEGLAKIVYRY